MVLGERARRARSRWRPRRRCRWRPGPTSESWMSTRSEDADQQRSSVGMTWRIETRFESTPARRARESAAGSPATRRGAGAGPAETRRALETRASRAGPPGREDGAGARGVEMGARASRVAGASGRRPARRRSARRGGRRAGAAGRSGALRSRYIDVAAISTSAKPTPGLAIATRLPAKPSAQWAA